MKSKILLIIQIVLMYLSNIALWGSAFVNDDFSEIVVTACLLLLVVAFIISIVYAIRCVRSLERKTYKRSLIAKLAIIPWYVTNVLAILYINLNSEIANIAYLVMILLPLMIVLDIGFSILFLYLTSAPNILYSLKLISKGETKPSFVFGLAIICHFLPILDIVGAIILFKKEKKDD